MIEAIREAGYWLTKRKTLAERRATELRAKWKDPTAARHWHNPADPVQAARIEAAAAKRERKAAKRDRDLRLSYEYNNAHPIEFRFAPFYVAK